MSKNLIKKVMVREEKPHPMVPAMIEKIESGYLVGRETKHKKKKSFSPSTLVYGAGKCFAGETEFLTDEGYKTLAECEGEEVTVWTGGSRIGNSKVRKSGGWKKATVANFGQQQLFKIVVSRNGVTKDIFSTANHRWLTRNRVDRSPIKIKETLDLLPGDKFEQSNTSDITSKNISWDGIRRWTVESVTPTTRFEDVYCVVEPETEQFTLDGGILTKNCPRYWFYAFSGADFADDADAYAVANMSNGTLSHERIQKAMKDSGVMIEDEVKIINDDPPIFGFADGMLMWEDEPLVAEIKTMREESFSYRKNTNKAPVYHLEQILLYMKVLKMAKGVLIYESKNSHELHIIPVDVKPEYIEWVDHAFAWMKTVRKVWEDEQLPMKPYRSNSKVCKGCPVKDTCFAGPKGDVKLLPLEPLKT